MPTIVVEPKSKQAEPYPVDARGGLIKSASSVPAEVQTDCDIPNSTSSPALMQRIVKKGRIEGLDQLRGILALTVMLYHYTLWSGFQLSPMIQRPLDELGLYAVSTFYVLSGCALYIVYHRRQLNASFFKDFWVKRAARIVPLFWVATTLTLIFVVYYRSLGALDSNRLFLNYSVLFSWFDPTAYYATGAWSIGNEWAFYTLFPLLIWSVRGNRFRLWLISVFTILSASWFAFFIMSPHQDVSAQWKHYINPLNQWVLFAGGFFLGKRVLAGATKKTAFLFIAASTFSFLLLSCVFSRPQSLSGFLRFAFVLICMAWCYGFGVLKLPDGKLNHTLVWMGAISYSVYLLHPLVYGYGSAIIGKALSFAKITVNSEFLSTVIFVLSIPAALGVAHLVHYKFELRIMRHAGGFLSKVTSLKSRGSDQCQSL